MIYNRAADESRIEIIFAREDYSNIHNYLYTYEN